MANLSTARTQPEHEAGLPPDPLSAVEQAHARLAATMAEMDEVTRDRSPDRFRFTHARFRLSSASLARRQLFNAICAHLLPRVSPADGERVQVMQQIDRELMSRSAAHVTKWSADAVHADWEGYCRASRDIRQRMQRAMDQDGAC